MDIVLQALGFAFMLLPWFIWAWAFVTVLAFLFVGWDRFDNQDKNGLAHY